LSPERKYSFQLLRCWDTLVSEGGSIPDALDFNLSGADDQRWWAGRDLNPSKRGDIPCNSLIFSERNTVDK